MPSSSEPMVVCSMNLLAAWEGAPPVRCRRLQTQELTLPVHPATVNVVQHAHGLDHPALRSELSAYRWP